MKIIPLSRFTVLGNSMLPTLKPGQDVLVFNWWQLLKLKVGDVVVFKKNGKEMIKRIRQILYGRIIFVQGDNKKVSTDSRCFGPVNMDQVVGKVIYIKDLF